jgi:putative glutathione S-transferase
MGILVNGQWRDEDLAGETGSAGEFRRIEIRFRDRAISVACAIPGERGQGWTFGGNAAFPDCTPDTVNGFPLPPPGVHRQRHGRHPHGYGAGPVGRQSPAGDRQRVLRYHTDAERRVRRHRRRQYGLLSAGDAAEIDRVNDFVHVNVNNGVHRRGFVRSQESDEAAYDALFAALDELEARLGRHRYLVGNRVTEADWRPLPTPVRFDAAYLSLLKCNRRRTADYRKFANHMRELCAVPGMAETVKPRYDVIGYCAIAKLNPGGITPKGAPVDLVSPHDRARLAARRQPNGTGVSVTSATAHFVSSPPRRA